MMEPSAAEPVARFRVCSSSHRALACAGVSEGRSCREPGVDPRRASLDRLQAALALDLLHASLPSVAARLGTSSRSLQRHLRELGTSFRLELAEARVREAKRRMQSPRLTLTTIALDLGFASIQGFGRSFRRSTGVCPGAWRSATHDNARAAQNDQQIGGSGNAERSA